MLGSLPSFPAFNGCSTGTAIHTFDFVIELIMIKTKTLKLPTRDLECVFLQFRYLSLDPELAVRASTA